MKDVLLILYKEGNAFDISDLAECVKWKGRKGSAARSLIIDLIDNDSAGNEPAGIDVERGDTVTFIYKGDELFRGIIMSQQQSGKFRMTAAAYDSGIYLANNKDTFVYENKTLNEIFRDICKRFEIKYSAAANTSYKIPVLTKSKTTAWDVIQDAASQEFKATGTRYFADSKNGMLRLLKRTENMIPWVLETGNNIISYNAKKSIENIKTRLKIYSDEDTVFAVKKNEALEKKIGIFQEIEKKDDKLSVPKLNEHVSETLKEISTPESRVDIEAFGIPDVISGACVYVIIDRLGIKRKFYVDEDIHTFKNGGHTMNLTLNSIN